MMQKILIVSHCILNKSSKVEHDEDSLAEEYATRFDFLQTAIKNDIQLIQLPCPEFIMYGSRRWGHVKNQFDNPFFRENCRKIFLPILNQIEEYISRKDKFNIIGIVSVEGSPSCGNNLTCISKEWKGEFSDCNSLENKLKSLEMKNEQGVFMKIISDMMKENNIDIPILSMQEALKKIQ